mgnify:CR=1 FL=1
MRFSRKPPRVADELVEPGARGAAGDGLARAGDAVGDRGGEIRRVQRGAGVQGDDLARRAGGVGERLQQHRLRLGGIGDAQLKINVMALLSGGGVRAGLEDNIWFDDDRTTLATNSDLILRIIKIADAMGYKPYAHEELRGILIGN